MTRPTEAQINLGAVVENYRLAQSIYPDGQCLAVVKANAYGHGAIAVAKALDAIAPAFGVACMEEADELRSAGIEAPILLLEGLNNTEELLLAAEKNYWVIVDSLQQLTILISSDIPKPMQVWVKIDTGMHRLGLPLNEVANTVDQLNRSSNVQDNIVLMTHLACADEPDNTLNSLQLERFSSVAKDFELNSSIANSAALMALPASRGNWNRAGYMLYGSSPLSSLSSSKNDYAAKLKTVMTLKSEIIALRDVVKGDSVGYGGNWVADRNSRIATIAIGYGDGYPRGAQNGTPVLVNGQRARLAGRVSMDMITVDVTDITGVKIGDEAVLWGNDLTINEVAQCAGTIGYELMTRMPSRTRRVYES